jgi:hypothetical protein
MTCSRAALVLKTHKKVEVDLFPGPSPEGKGR